MKLKELLGDIKVVRVTGNIDIDITGIAYDSRMVEKGNLFICITGYKIDGHKFIEDAINRGAVAILLENEIEITVTAIQVKNTRSAMPQFASRFYGNPTDKLRLIGLTGTNGKTTTSYLIKSILENSGKMVGLLGTISIKIGDKEVESTRTTPESVDLQKLFNVMANTKVTHAVMEVSSHSLDLGRVDGCNFHTGIFTNLTQDHLDFHQTIEKYRDAKEKLFCMTSGVNIINIDDEHGRIIANHIKDFKIPMYTYAIDRNADFMAKNMTITASGVSFILLTPDYSIDIKVNIPGKFSVYNALAAAAAAFVQGIEKESIKSGLERIKGVPGRSEVVNIDMPYTVIVDYAHTPDGMENILNSVREYVKGKIITVFGCGGDRDKTKRAIMGEIGGKLSDYCVITSDNPRSEDPYVIIKQIEEGIKKTKCKYDSIESRRKAIKKALSIAEKDDVILIIGKGHETYQVLRDRTIPFDDREVVLEMLKEE